MKIQAIVFIAGVIILSLVTPVVSADFKCITEWPDSSIYVNIYPDDGFDLILYLTTDNKSLPFEDGWVDLELEKTSMSIDILVFNSLNEMNISFPMEYYSLYGKMREISANNYTGLITYKRVLYGINESTNESYIKAKMIIEINITSAKLHENNSISFTALITQTTTGEFETTAKDIIMNIISRMNGKIKEFNEAGVREFSVILIKGMVSLKGVKQVVSHSILNKVFKPVPLDIEQFNLTFATFNITWIVANNGSLKRGMAVEMTIFGRLIDNTYLVYPGNETGIGKALFIKPPGRVVASYMEDKIWFSVVHAFFEGDKSTKEMLTSVREYLLGLGCSDKQTVKLDGLNGTVVNPRITQLGDLPDINVRKPILTKERITAIWIASLAMILAIVIYKAYKS